MKRSSAYGAMPQTFRFLMRLGKLYGPVARGKSIQNHPLAIRWILAVYGRPGVFCPLVNVSFGFCKVHTGPCGRTGLETPHLRGCTEPASGLYEAREIPYEVHRIQQTDTLSCLGSFTVTGRLESLTFSHGLSPTVPKLCKTLCGLAWQTYRLPKGSAHDFHVTKAF